jgi:uncharacterized protein (DUF362 family)
MAAGTGFAAGSLMAAGSGTGLRGRASARNLQDFELVAVKGGEPGVMFDRAILGMGGMEKFVKRGQTVAVKPNIGWDALPERAANTNPRLVAKIIEHCLAAGAKDVYVFDHTINEWTRCYKNSGIEKAARDAGGKIVSGSSQGRYHEIEVPSGKILKKVHVHELILESDVFINVPILKHHGGAGLCIAMKNLMGTVWDRKFWHANGLHQCIADYASAVQPDLNVVDGYRVIMKNGPRGVSVSDVETRKFLILTPDIVAADVAATKFLAKNPEQIGHIRIAGEMGLGENDLSKLQINRIQI